ncbi:MAG: MOSC domain-containing protein [Rhodospirillales bacterium]|nr:MOSC domain-containing protein [Rhodospirillales bacterium]
MSLDQKTAAVRSIYRYPFKGLSPEPLDAVRLEVGECLPGDRSYALARPDASFDAANPSHLPKTNFLMLMRDEALAGLDAAFEEDGRILTIKQDGETQIAGCVENPSDRDGIEEYFSRYLGANDGRNPRLVSAAGHSFSDKPAKVVSIINLASVAALSEIMGKEINPLRFRANIYIEDMQAFGEFEWVGTEIGVGECRFEIIEPIRRCAAVDVDPITARRDTNIPKVLAGAYGHVNMGVYGRVTTAGKILPGDKISAE